MKIEAINSHSFDSYLLSEFDYNKSIGNVQYSHVFSESQGVFKQKTTVFVSHKHSDLKDYPLLNFLGWLKNYNVDPYIDSFDKSMPENTCGETAKRIKEKITSCNKFILFATNNAINSKWCNWELGFGDSQKYEKDNIAIIPIENTSGEFSGSEYLQIYPYIVYRDGTTFYSNTGERIKSGFYIRYDKKNVIIPLSQWLDS